MSNDANYSINGIWRLPIKSYRWIFLPQFSFALWLKVIVLLIFVALTVLTLNNIILASALPSQNMTDEVKQRPREIADLHDLLNSYNAILYRYNEDQIEEKRMTSYHDRSDRHRRKYTKDQAIKQLQNVDNIFPIYENYFNITNEPDLNALLSERVQNVENTLKKLDDKYSSSCSGMIQAEFLIASAMLSLLIFL